MPEGMTGGLLGNPRFFAVLDHEGRVLDLDFHPDMWHTDSLIWKEMPWS
jgi:hypothetical protein